MLKNSDFLTGFTEEFSSVAAYERIDRDVLQRRLLLALFALGTNIGIRSTRYCCSRSYGRHVCAPPS